LLSRAQAQDDSELAKKTQNPVADLISVPLQSNFNFGGAGKAIDVVKLAPKIKQALEQEMADAWKEHDEFKRQSSSTASQTKLPSSCYLGLYEPQRSPL
jgi:hypothetical protein